MTGGKCSKQSWTPFFQHYDALVIQYYTFVKKGILLSIPYCRRTVVTRHLSSISFGYLISLSWSMLEKDTHAQIEFHSFPFTTWSSFSPSQYHIQQPYYTSWWWLRFRNSPVYMCSLPLLQCCQATTNYRNLLCARNASRRSKWSHVSMRGRRQRLDSILSSYT